MATRTVPNQSRPTTAYQADSAAHHGGLLASLARDIKHLNEWLAGPAMTDRDRLNRAMAETQSVRWIGPQPF